MINKTIIASIFNIDESYISDSVFLWAKKQFFALTGLQEAEVSKTYMKILPISIQNIKLPFRGVKQVDSIKVDNVEIYDDADENTGYFLNNNSGLLKLTSAISCNKLEVTYTVNKYAHLDIHDLLIALLTYKSFILFTPDRLGQVKKIQIGKYSKTFAAVTSSQTKLIDDVDSEIERMVNIILGDDMGIGYSGIV